MLLLVKWIYLFPSSRRQPVFTRRLSIQRSHCNR